MPIPGVSKPGPLCPKCDRPTRYREGSNGPFYGCTGYPACRGTVDIPDPDAPSCPECDEPMKKRSSDRGDFWGCSNFPTCKGIRKMDGETGGGVASRAGATADAWGEATDMWSRIKRWWNPPFPEQAMLDRRGAHLRRLQKMQDAEARRRRIGPYKRPPMVYYEQERKRA